MLILGGLLVRTWMHLPTYDNELRFYLSNTWNFPDSEVAHGNLGVTYLRAGYSGAAVDTWKQAAVINPDYDVPHYNIYSYYRSGAMNALTQGNYAQCVDLLRTAKPHLERCLKCSVCHFKTDWDKELETLNQDIANPMRIVLQEEQRLLKLEKELKEKPKDPGIEVSLSDIKKRLDHINSMKPKKDDTPKT